MGKRIWSRVLVLTLALVMLVSSAALAATRSGIVKTPTTDGAVNIRKGPGTRYQIIAVAKYGDKLSILSTASLWYKVKHIRTGKTGYISSEYVSILDAPTKAWGNVGHIETKYAGNSVYLRSGPGTNYSIKDSLKDGEKLCLIRKSGNWQEVQAVPSGKSGYVHASYVKAGIAGKITGNVHLRQKDSASSKSLAVLKKKASITVLNVGSNWSKVKAGGKTGYISNRYYQFK